jgi:hypothetical protein
MTPIWIEYVCAACSRTEVGMFVFEPRIPVKKLKKAALAAGYIFYKNEVFCCDSCKQQWSKQND